MLPQQIALLCFLDLHIYTAGGGNPLYCAELLKQCSSIKNWALKLFFFCKFGILHDEGRRESKKMMKNRQKVLVFSLLVLGPDLLRDILGSA